MNQITTLDSNNFSAMAQAMGMDTSLNTKQSASTLARLRISHTPIMGQTEMKGKKVNVEVVPAGCYRLEIPDGPMYYASDITIRPYMQRYMYKRFIKGSGDIPNRYVKTVMNNTLSVDLKDNDGGFNCGKPAGYIQDFKALPAATQDLIRTIKRVRVVFGIVELKDPVDANGEPVTVEPTPFIWEVDNRDAYKSVGEIFNVFSKSKRLPPMHSIVATTEERALSNGNSFFIPNTSVDLKTTHTLGDSEQETFANFLSWVDNYNLYILKTWTEKAMSNDDEDDEVLDKDFIDNIVDIDEEDNV